MSDQIIEIRKHLSNTLPPGRYEHTISVSYTCICLAMCYGYSLEQAELAGLLHDCAKRYSETVLIEKCKQRHICLTPEELLSPTVIHAKYGAWIAQHEYGISNQEILNAISCHTTGKPGMSLLDRILYIADYIEPRRYKVPNLTAIRALAFTNLDHCLFLILESTLNFLSYKKYPIHPMTQQAFDFYKPQQSVSNKSS